MKLYWNRLGIWLGMGLSVVACTGSFAQAQNASTASAIRTPVASALVGSATEIDLWLSAQADGSPAAYTRYLQAYPNGTFAALARSRAAAPVLADMLPSKPTVLDARIQVAEAKRLAEWDEAAWARVLAANTPSGYEEYLLALPRGKYRSAAIEGLLKTRPALPQNRPTGCTLPDQRPQVIRQLDRRSAFPEAAISKWKGGVALGEVLVSSRGQPMVYLPQFHSDPVLFSDKTEDEVRFMRYVPARHNCVDIQGTQTIYVTFIAGDMPFESRPNASGEPAQLADGQTFIGTLDETSANVHRLPVSPFAAVYEFTHKARFPILLSTDRAEKRPLELVNNKLVVVPGNTDMTIRVSAPDMPNSRRKHKGRYELTVKRIWQDTKPAAPDIQEKPKGAAA